jgi:FlaA1/EpsC-like NDP-sugar epimerase
MGAPVKIIDLAQRMIELSGLSLITNENPWGDIEISVSGLRPGEKLYEELLIGGDPKKTEHKRIFRANEDYLSLIEFKEVILNIDKALIKDDYISLQSILESDVIGFKAVGDIVDWMSR